MPTDYTPEEAELRARLAELAQARKAAMIAYDVDRVLKIREEMGRLTAEIHRLHREQRRSQPAP